MLSRTFSYSLLTLLAVVNVLVDRSLVEDVRKVLARRPPPHSHYSFIEDDVPERMSLVGARPHVVMSLEESVRYGVDEPQAYLEWLWTSTADDMGNVHMGPNQRFGVVGITHELHCLRALRGVLADDEVPTSGRPLHHSEHCLSFLREHTLCAADMTLEPGDAFARNFTAERVTVERECMDAKAYYATMWRQWNRWLDFKQQQQQQTK